ncbi:MAG: hypothetical protein QM598_09660 [Protaetiibacter sp.]
MTVAEAFAGLVEFDPTLLGVDEEIMSIIPTFTSGDPRTDPRPDVIMFPRGTASAPTAKHVGTVQGTDIDVSDAEVKGWYDRLGSSLTSSVRRIPTFVFGRSGNKRYIDVITVRSFTSLRVAVRGMPDPVAKPRDFFSAAQSFAKGNGFVAGTPSFLRDGDDWEILAFGPAQVLAGRGFGVGWTFRELPVHTDSLGVGVAVEETGSGSGARQLAVFTIPGEEVWQHRPGADADVDVRVFPAPGQPVRDLWSGPMPSMVSAASTATRLSATWGDFAWFVADRAPDSPKGFLTTTVSGRQPANGADTTSGIVAAFNSISPEVDFAAGMLSVPVGTARDATWDERVNGNLAIARRISGDTWEVAEVDGDADEGERMLGRAGESSTFVRGVEGHTHVFYSLAVPVGSGGTSQRLRHGTFQAATASWRLETLDGSGQQTPPPSPGTGRVRASVGLNPTAAVFDGRLWVVYEDLTYGNLRCAVGTPRGGDYDWSFSVLDGSRGWQRTPHPVALSSMVAWEDRLSVFYVDIERRVLRHASRVIGGGWRYEVVDGAGGVAGRIREPIASVRAIAAGRDANGRPRRPLHAVYTVDRSQLPTTVDNVRLATLS